MSGAGAWRSPWDSASRQHAAITPTRPAASMRRAPPTAAATGTGWTASPAAAAGPGRRIPRRSSSSTITRAASARSGSRVIVPASQSTYEGSNATISPSVCPWNLPKVTSRSSASLDRRRLQRNVAGEAVPLHRPGRLRGAELRGRTLRSGMAAGPVSGIREPGRRGGLVAGPDRPAEVEAAGDRASSWAAAAVPRRGCRACPGPDRRAGTAGCAGGAAGGPVPARSSFLGLAGPGQGRVGRVDLRHPSGRPLERPRGRRRSGPGGGGGRGTARRP